MIIDMRLRPPWKGFLSLSVFNYAPGAYAPEILGVNRPRSAIERSMDLLFEEMEQSGIVAGVMTGRQAVEPFGRVPNDDIYELAELYPGRLIGLPALDVGRPREAMAELHRAAEHSLITGVHLEPMGASPAHKADDRALYPLYAEAESVGLIVAISGGGTMGPDFTYVDPIAIQHVAKDFPGLKLVLCHGGWPWVNLALAVAYSCPNVYISPDMYMIVPNMPGALEYVRAANFFLEDRLLFGTAYPARPLRESVAAFHELPFRDDKVKEKVLYANAASLFRLQEETSLGRLGA